MSSSNYAAPNVYKTGGTGSWFLLSLLCLAFFFDYADRFILSALLPFIKQDWQLTDQALGTLTGILAIPMAVLALPFAIAVDRWSRKKMIALCVFLWSCSTLACAFAENYEQLLLFRALTGVGEAGYAPAAIASIAAAFAWNQRAKVTGIWDAFAPLGAAAGFAIGGIIGAMYGWRHAFGIMAVPGLLVAVAILFTRDYKTVALDDNAGSSFSVADLVKSTRSLFLIPSLRFVWMGFTLNFAVNTAMMAWMPIFFIRFQGMNAQAAGKAAGILALMALVGAPLGGILSDRWMKSRYNARMLVCAIASICSAVFLLAALVFAQSVLFWPLIVGFGVCSVAFLAPGAATIQDVAHPGLRAIAYGINVTFLNLLGASWSPGFIGWMSDSRGLNTALLFLPILGVIAALMFHQGSKHYQADMSNVKEVVLMAE